MKYTKKFGSILLVLSLMVMVGFHPAISLSKEKYEKKFQKTVQLSQTGKVKLKNISGYIEVKTWNRSEVKIDALKVSKASSLSKAEENAQKVKIEVNKSGDLLEIETDYSKHSSNSLNVSVDYNLMVPSRVSLDLNSVSGDVFMEKIGGEVEAEVVSGNIEMMGAGKDVDCQTVSGDLRVQDVKGYVVVFTVSGDLSLERIKGSVEAETVSGNVEMKEVTDAEKIKGKTLNGEIVYEGSLRKGSRYNFNSHSGDIHLNIPASSSFELEAKTFSGEIESDFEIALSGKVSSKKIRGTVNEGGAELSLDTFSGDVYLKKK
ncbi:DUF4097 family beta strand repeat protein [bacterium]|nr:DUF4097 family beta strand repeat protein [bacterium]